LSLSIGVPAALSAVNALLKYRVRVDEILALKEATDSIPFSLPPAPFDFVAQKDAMFAFFASEKGRLILELRARTEAFAQLKRDPLAPATAELRDEFLQLFFEASDTAPIVMGPQAEARSVRASQEMRLSYYVVSSHRLSRNPALTRILLATADTLLEVAGDNAGLFISNLKTRVIVGSLIQEFAGKRDFDDDSAELILRSLLRSAVVAAVEERDAITEAPALVALFQALSGMREAFGDDFVAQIITKRGFQTLVGRYLTEIAEDPSFLVEDGPYAQILGATLKDLGENFVGIFDDPRALFGVLEVALTSAAGQAPALLAKRIGNKPLLSAVLQSVLGEIKKKGRNNALFRSFASGEIVSGVFQASMSAVAANPGGLASAARINALSASLVAGVASVFSSKELSDVLSPETLRSIASSSLRTLAQNSSEWASNSEFATRLAVGVLKASASAVEDGLAQDDVDDLLDAAIRTASANIGLLKLDVHAEILLEAVGGQLSTKGVRALLTPDSRRDVIFTAVETVSRNPKIWSKFAEADLVQPLVSAVFEGLATDKTALFAGPTMVAAVQSVLTAAALRGQKLIDREVGSDEVKLLLSMALRKLDQEIGRSIDSEDAPAYIRRIVDGFLADPFELGSISASQFKQLHELAMMHVLNEGGIA
jgi:hypothetical protein